MRTIDLNPTSALEALPSGPLAEKVTDKYMFLDTRKVVEDMRDLGYEVTGFRRPATRTAGGAYGLHEVQFQKPEHLTLNGREAPRIVFMNSYDGSRRAKFAAGLIRWVCLNGCVFGDNVETRTFLHLGDYEADLMAEINRMAVTLDDTFDRLEAYRDIKLDEDLYVDMAMKAIPIRYPDEETRPIVDPTMLLMPRRQEDVADDLFTRWNVLQENVIRGSVPVRSADGRVQLSRPVENILRSNQVNRELWNLLDTAAEAA